MLELQAEPRVNPNLFGELIDL